MVTIKQLLTIQAQIEKKTEELSKLKIKRSKMLKSSSEINSPTDWRQVPAETFVKVDEKPCRILVDKWDHIQVEELPF